MLIADIGTGVSTSGVIALVVSGLAALTAALGWTAKILWITEYRDAKEAEIAALKRQVELLEKLTASTLLKHLVDTKQAYDSIIADKDKGIAELHGTSFEEAKRLNKELDHIFAKLMEWHRLIQRNETLR